jgi:hypothetical protein
VERLIDILKSGGLGKVVGEKSFCFGFLDLLIIASTFGPI